MSKEDILYSLNDLCWKYFKAKASYEDLEAKIMEQREKMIIYGTISIESPNYQSVSVYFFDKPIITNPESFNLTNQEELQKLLNILKCRIYERRGKYIVGFNIWSYNIGYRLKYAREYGYEQLFQQIHPDHYATDVKYWANI